MTSPRIEKLTRFHDVGAFDCGQGDLNRFLFEFALASQLANASQTYVAVMNEQVIGYHTLVVGEVDYVDAPERLTKGMARHPIPLMLIARIARIAVDRQWQGNRIGSGLLKDAMKRTLDAADIAGIRAIAVHAKDENARAFYEHFDFVPSPVESLRLFMLLKDVRREVDAG